MEVLPDDAFSLNHDWLWKDLLCFWCIFSITQLIWHKLWPLCNEMWLLSTALFNCKNCCKLQIYSHDAVLTELLSELWRDSMEVSSLLLFLCFPLKRDGKSRLCPSMWKNMLSVVAYWSCKLLPGKYCQRTLNWNYKGVKI